MFTISIVSHNDGETISNMLRSSDVKYFSKNFEILIQRIN